MIRLERFLPIMHRIGTTACDGVVCYTTTVFEKTDRIDVSALVSEDGQPVTVDGEFRCGSCGEWVNPINFRQLLRSERTDLDPFREKIERALARHEATMA